LNELAWSFVSKGATDAFVAEMACKAAERALRLSPKNGMIMNTLGIAYYRAGQWQDAIGTLEKSMALRLGGDANDWFFLAMAHWNHRYIHFIWLVAVINSLCNSKPMLSLVFDSV
jgi:tetratricopeptide (TPR) repeat protein